MTPEQRLIRNIRSAAGPRQLSIWQGIVISVEGATCTVEFGSQQISGVRLRASLADVEEQLLVVPKDGSAVVVGSLSGDLSDLAVLVVDEAERIEIGGATLGGLVNIEPLISGLNDLVDAYNRHTHSVHPGGVVVGELVNTAPVSIPKTPSQAKAFDREKIEDTRVQH